MVHHVLINRTVYHGQRPDGLTSCLNDLLDKTNITATQQVNLLCLCQRTTIEPSALEFFLVGIYGQHQGCQLVRQIDSHTCFMTHILKREIHGRQFGYCITISRCFTYILYGVFAELIESHVKQRLFKLHRTWMDEIAKHIKTLSRGSARGSIANHKLLLTRDAIQHHHQC